MVTLFDHGILSPLPFYFIDMELCDFSLHDYLYNHDDSMKCFEEDSECAPALVCRDCSVFQRMEHICRLGGDIAGGLEFLHANYVVHRDIKPGNGKA